MKIVYCLPQLYRPGGIERIVSIKANYLADVLGYEVVLILANQQNRTPFYRISDKIHLYDLEIDYDAILYLPLIKRVISKQKLQKEHRAKLEDLLFRIKADIVISTLGNEASMIPSLKDGSRKVLEFHFCKGHKRKMANAFRFGFITKLAYYFRCWQEENLIIPKYDRFVVLTNEDLQSWKKHVANVLCIPNIIPFDNIERTTLNNKIVLSVGRLDAQKNFSKMITLWEQVCKQNKEWQLHIYGEGDDREKIEKIIKEKKLESTVFLKGNSNNLLNVYKEASIFTMTSAYEGMPMTMLEAKAIGLPVVSFAFPCGPKDLIDDGKDGYVVEVGDDEKYVSSLLELMNDSNLRNKFGENSYLRARQYRSRAVMDMWNNLFISLVNNNSCNE